MPKKDPLLAHIQTDPFLFGTVGLQGHYFSDTTQYFKDYFEQLKSGGEEVDSLDLKLLQDMDYLVTIENQLKTNPTQAGVACLAKTIVDDLSSLAVGGKLLLPGGWAERDGGHAMIYQFTRRAEDYLFTVINSGAGINYHAKKSSSHKELYNPMKTWEVPCFETDKEQSEVGYFLERLLQALLPSHQQSSTVDASVLYDEILPNISFLHGKEVDANIGFPEHGWTGSQLSGTCTQRVIHQMMKVNSQSAEAYQHKIFKFKLYNLDEYLADFYDGEEAGKAAMAGQIRLAVENNLKILNTPNLFSDVEKEMYANKLNAITSKLGQITFATENSLPEPGKVLSQLTVTGEKVTLLSLHDSNRYASELFLMEPVRFDKNGRQFLLTLANAIENIQPLKDMATRYVCLEQLILELPLNEKGVFASSIYSGLKTLEDYTAFQQHIDDIQELLCVLQKEWLQDAQTPAFNHLVLSVLSLQTDVYAVIANNWSPGLPSFAKFTEQLMTSLVDNHHRDPFIATNNPAFDLRASLLQRRYHLQRKWNNGAGLPVDLFFNYLKGMLSSEPSLDAELHRRYNVRLKGNTQALHEKIRAAGLESLYMLSLHLVEIKLEAHFNPLIAKFTAHFALESKLRRAINPFYAKECQFLENQPLELRMHGNTLLVCSPLFPAHVHRQKHATLLTKYKYNISASPAANALQADISQHSVYQNIVVASNSNDIQLKSVQANASAPVTQADIVARDYFHLRTQPSMQIALTLDYFIRHISRLAEEPNQRYVEANLFQPGLLLDACKQPEFLSQFDDFLTTGMRFFTENGQHTRNSLLFLRLDFLVSRYLLLAENPAGAIRLENLQEALLKQLAVAIEPDVIYVLQQYLLLTIMARIESGETLDDGLFTRAFSAYFYLQGHTNPSILEDTCHGVAVACTYASFKILTGKQADLRVKQAVEATLLQYEPVRTKELSISGKFPIYKLTNQQCQTVLQVNAHLGKLFENELARSGVPLVIQNHPLIKQQELQHVRECFMNADGNYMILHDQKRAVRLFYKNDRLTIQTDWRVQNSTRSYELQALSEEHLAYLANKNINPVKSELPTILTDGSMNYWQDVKDTKRGLLVQNNIPVYSIQSGNIKVLNARGAETAFKLSILERKWHRLFHAFESNDFLLVHAGVNDTLVKLPRYDLSFEIASNSPHPVFVCKETGESIVDCPSPIHPSVAGIVLEQNNQVRYLVPVARFYATEHKAKTGDMYPVVHDISAVIANDCLDAEWKRKQAPQWHYQNSEAYLSFQLKDGRPVSGTAAAALYLAYVYLAANQTEMAWNILEDCNTRLGGLTGAPEEVQFVAWICNDLPYVLSNDALSKAIRKTPPYVACQLKALSLVCDYLSQDRVFNVKATPDVSDNTANSHYALLQHKSMTGFLNALPETIYEKFTRLQRMGRHLEHGYQLSVIERKRLLGYYHQSQPQNHAPRGALGYEWMALSLRGVAEEREALLARGELLSSADKKRLGTIDDYFKKLQPVSSVSTTLELVAIDLDLPQKSTLKHYNEAYPYSYLPGWLDSLPGERFPDKDCQEVIRCLSSGLTNKHFIISFPAMLQIAVSPGKLSTSLKDFCTATLLSKRHISLSKQTSDIPLLCNILYRVLNNPPRFLTYLEHQQGKTTTFSELVQETASYTVPALKVYQARDIYKHILATPEDIIAKVGNVLPRPVRAIETATAPLLAHLQLESSLSVLPSLHKTVFEEIRANYRRLQDEHALVISNLGKALSDDLEPNFVIETEAGKYQLALEKNQKKLVERFMTTPGLADAIRNMVLLAMPELTMQIEQSWQDALALANQGPDEPVRARTWAIEKDSGARAPLGKAVLMSLYTRADLVNIMEQTALSAEHAERLHKLVHNALVNGIRQQTLEKIANSLDASITSDAGVIALDILAKAQLPALHSPATVVIQHEERILLRPGQVIAIDTLLKEQDGGQGYNETILKMTMGEGKTTLIEPVIVEYKARGDNLVVLEVPKALLASNHVDLNRTSQRLFGKRASLFEFNRDSNCSPARLEQLYQQFTEIMTTRGYLITTGEAIQSLELKYLELLLANDQPDAVWEKQIYWLDNITNLFRNHADCIIDEVHQGLWLKKKLNYTRGESPPLGSLLIANAIALYSLLDTDFIRQAPSFPDDYDWANFKKTLASKLLNNPASPLQAFIRNALLKYGKSIQDELMAYLTNTATTMSNAILYATAEERATLAYFKREIDVLLPQTLSRRLDEHYGASKRSGISPVEQMLAIPYAANNVPNERSRFGVELEALNYTMQMMLLKGISKELLMERVVGWQALARQELLQNPALKHLDETPTARGFALQVAATGLTLSQINSDKPRQIATLYAHLQYSRPLIFDCLREQVLKQIHHDTSIIHSDAFNHVDQYRSAQGVSGSPSNYTNYHQRFSYDKAASLGSDGYIIELIEDKNTAISALDYQNPYQFIEGILSKSAARDRCRAIIDIRATFQGVSNIVVAQELARYLRVNNPAIKQVLYFDEDQVLCAIQVDNPAKPLILASTNVDEINRLLGSKPGERFTYYDQAHTVGSDITQDEMAHAIVLADDKTSMDAFLQGCMRMRGLRKSQTMEIIVPGYLDGITAKELFKCFAAVSRNQLLEDNLPAAKGRMTNFIRRRLLSLIQDLPASDAKAKALLAGHFNVFFASTPVLDLFELYGSLNRRQATSVILERCCKQLLSAWGKCMASAGLAVSVDLANRMRQDLQDILVASLAHCLAEYDDMDTDLSLEVEAQNQVQKEVKVQVSVLNECYEPGLRSAGEFSWRRIDCGALYTAKDSSKYGHIIAPMNTVCSDAHQTTTFFSDNFAASQNFARTYIGQSHAIGAFLKPVFLIWYHIESHQLHAMLVTPTEAEELVIAIRRLPNSWIATTRDTLIVGYRPEGILLEKRYQALREQVRFFNGELECLVNQKTPLYWLQEQVSEKLDFFENNLQAYRPGSASELRALKMTLTEGNLEGFQYIAAHPYENFADFDWKIMFPKSLPVQITEYKKLADAFAYMNVAWSSSELSLDFLQQHFYLSTSTLDYVDAHIKQIAGFRYLVERMDGVSPETPFLQDLSDRERDCLELCLGMPLAEFCESYGIDYSIKDNKPEASRQLADIQALHMLSRHPLILNDFVMVMCLLGIARKALSAEVLWALLKNSPLSALMIPTIIAHPLSDESMVTFVFTLGPVSAENSLVALARKCQTPEQIDRLFSQPGLTEQVMKTVVKQPVFSPGIVGKILARAGNNISPLLLQDMAKNAFLKSHDTQDGNDVAAWEDALLAIIEHAVKVNCFSDMLDIIINKQRVAPRLAGKIHKAPHIDALLASPEMTCDIADILFQKPEFSGKVGDWKWLTETQLLGLLDKACDFDSFLCVFRHDNLSSTARDSWLEKMRCQQLEDSSHAVDSGDPQQKIMAALNGFKIKASSHVLKSLEQDKYAEVAKTAFNLYQDLSKEVHQHFQAAMPDNQRFQDNCTNMINSAMPVLQEHRGLKQALLDIINVICLCCTFGLVKPYANDWRLFKVATASVEEVGKFSACINNP